MAAICVSEQIGNCLKCADAVTLKLTLKISLALKTLSSSGANLPEWPDTSVISLIAIRLIRLNLKLGCILNQHFKA